jgi:hypothetical protein
MRSSHPPQPSNQPANLPSVAPGNADPKPTDQIEPGDGLAFDDGCDPEDFDDSEHDDD